MADPMRPRPVSGRGSRRSDQSRSAETKLGRAHAPIKMPTAEGFNEGGTLDVVSEMMLGVTGPRQMPVKTTAAVSAARLPTCQRTVRPDMARVRNPMDAIRSPKYEVGTVMMIRPRAMLETREVNTSASDDEFKQKETRM